ncbi:hypothetical protein E1292_02820 [Nonomuraea deserti]|uniref:Uncharacterized protein n=1 Tax=Nonomuraea deserti TaxID=1848322 RepID=A0A4R4W7K6_9ACTN|nr:hypothetical protein [Nonomuraea deserti]TDD12073.1 hypothetical protein E1292_02820 [Nonomuraea deserti]
MADLVSYYVETTSAPGPGSLYRRSLTEGYGGRVDACFVPGKGTWRIHGGPVKDEDGRADNDFYGVHPDEAERVIAWLRRASEVGRRHAGPPPVLGEWSVGRAWVVELKGSLSEQAVATILSRLGMTRRAHADPRERDFGLRVLHSDMEYRWNFDLYHAHNERWFLRLLYLRRTPDERVIQRLRDQVHPLAVELGLEIVQEQVATQKSWPLSDRARREIRGDEEWLLVMWFHGQMTEVMLRTLHRRLNLEAEWGADLDEIWKLEWGIGYLPNDTRFRAQLRLRRGFNDENAWRFEIGLEGVRPPDSDIDRWRDEIMAASREVGLVYERDWLAPRPMPNRRTPPATRPVRTSAQVYVLYQAYLDGQFTAATLDEFRDALGIHRRGRIDNDAEQFYGDRVLRDEDHRLVRLMLARTFDGDWYLSLSYQDMPPDQDTVDQMARDIHAAAARGGLTVGREQHFPPGR